MTLLLFPCKTGWVKLEKSFTPLQQDIRFTEVFPAYYKEAHMRLNLF